MVTTYRLPTCLCVSCVRAGLPTLCLWTRQNDAQHSLHKIPQGGGDVAACRLNPSKGLVETGEIYLFDGETDMKNFMLKTGPISIAVDALHWKTYKAGIFHTFFLKVPPMYFFSSSPHNASLTLSLAAYLPHYLSVMTA